MCAKGKLPRINDSAGMLAKFYQSIRPDYGWITQKIALLRSLPTVRRQSPNASLA